MLKYKIISLTSLMIMFLFFPSCTSLNKPHSYWGKIENQEVKDFVSKVRPHKGNPSNYYKFGCYLKNKKKYKRAIEEFHKVLALDPEHVQSLNAMGICYDHLGYYSKAISAYKKSLQINSNLDYAYNNLGYSYLLNKEYDLAIKAFKKAIELNDQNSRYHNNLGLAYFKTGQYFLARDHIEIGKGRASFYSKLALLEEKEPNHNEGKKESQNSTEKIDKNLINPAPDLQCLKDDKKVKKHSNINKSGQVTSDDQAKDKNDLIGNTRQKIIHQDNDLNKNQGIKEYKKKNNLLDNSKELSKIEISNGNGVYRMATNVGEYLKERNFSVTRLTNAAHFNFEKTKLYYCPGYLHEAYELAKQIPGWQNMDKVSELYLPEIKIKLLIGKDIVQHKDMFFKRNR